MNRIILTVFLVVFSNAVSFACSCNFGGGFLKVASESQVIVIAKVEQIMDFRMSVSVTDIFKGETKDKIIIVGDRGDQCLESIKRFDVGSNYAFALKESEGKYFLSNCGAYYVKLEGGLAYGIINHEFLDYSNGSWPQYNGKTLPLETFKSEVAKHKGYPYPCKVVNTYIPNAYLDKQFQEAKDKNEAQFNYAKVNWAISSNNMPLIKYYFERHKIEETEDLNKLAFTAISKGNIEVVKFLIEKGLSKNATNKYSGTLLGAAVRYPDLVNYLLEIGSDVNKANEKQKVPVMHAASDGCITSLEIILQKDVALDTKDYRGMTAIDYAKEYNDHSRAKAIELLKKK